MRYLLSSSACLALILSTGASSAAGPAGAPVGGAPHRVPFAARATLVEGPLRDAAGRVVRVDVANVPALEAAAKVLVEEHPASAAAPAAPAPRTGTARTRTLRNGHRVIRLPQEHAGVPVLFAGATVTFGPDGRGLRMALKLERDLPPATPPALDASAAAAIGARATGLRADASRARQAWWPTASGRRLAWVVLPARIDGLPYAPVAAIDAVSGAVLTRYDTAVSLNQAKVYPTNPVKSPELAAVTLAVSEGNTELESPLIRSRNCIDNKSVKEAFGFEVHTCDLVHTAIADEAGQDFLIAPADDQAPEDAFSEVSIFHHASRAYEHFRSFDPKLAVQKGPLDTVSNLRMPAGYETFNQSKMKNPDLPLVPYGNAFFAPASPFFESIFGIDGAAMWFGQGVHVDYSYDGDVVYHELTHAVVNATAKLVGHAQHDDFGLSYAAGGMDEGLADYFSSAIAGDPDVGEYAVKDFAPGGDAIRSLTADDACPTAIAGERHQDSVLFSAAMWDVRATLSAGEANDFDLAVFEAMNETPSGDIGYEDFANLLLGNVKVALGNAVAGALEEAFTKRGVLPRCTRVLEYTGGELTGPKDLYGIWVAPGLASTTLNSAPYAPGIVQVRAPLGDGAGRVTVAFKRVPGYSGGGFGQGGKPFTPKVLVRFGGDPLQFSYGPFVALGDPLLVAPEESGIKYFATADVPPGVTVAHVMVVNEGDDDGAYTDMSFTIEAAPPPPEPDAGAPVEDAGVPPPPDAGDDGRDEPKAAADEETDAGCGCSVPGAGSASTLSLAAAAAAVALSRARHRRREPARKRT